MNRITLFRTSQAWMADYAGPHAVNIERLFGTTLLPTAFTAKALPETVKRTIQSLNPAVIVELAVTDGN